MCPSDQHSHSDPIAVEVADTADVSAAPAKELIEELVAANQILFDQGVVDAFGHISVRHDKRPDRFLLARNMAPSRVTAEDIVEFALDGEAVNANGRKVYLERFIHAEIFRRRPDVMAVIHSHSHSVVPLSVVKGMKLKAIFHMAGFIGQGAPVFEIREAGGDATDLLISNSLLGRALAEHFDGHDIVLMRGHGSTVVGGSIKQAVYRAVYAELNARYQACIQNVEGQVQRPWDMWLEQSRARRD
jgi:ribulose-5-phosphate 4-epimerase/fuculose-1-phosphate aldolase